MNFFIWKKKVEDENDNTEAIKKQNKNLKTTWYNRAALIAYFPVAIYLLYALSRLSFFSIGIWDSICNYPLYFIINMLLLGIIILFLWGIFNNKMVVFSIANVVIVVLGLANCIKNDVRGMGFVIQDIFVLGEGAEMADALSFSFIMKAIIAAVISLVILFGLTILIKRFKFDLNFRVVMILIGLLSFFSLYVISPTIKYIEKDGIYSEAVASDVGGLYYFFLKLNTPSYPVGPSKKIVAEAFPNEAERQKPVTEFYPDIIIIQSESFADPTQSVPMTKFSEDPLPYFHALQEESMAIDLSVPTFGGGTATTEFEVLTSIPYSYYPYGTIPYKDLDTSYISLASILRKQGYNSLFIHPFTATYYNRNNALYHLGFNRFIGDRDFFETETTVGDERLFTTYASDMSMNQVIIKNLEDDSEQRKFIMAVTMQNHVPFVNEGKELPYDVKYTEGITPKESDDIFTAYLSKLRYTDDSIQMLVEYLKTREKPTILVYYGDHLPFVDTNYNVMNQTGWAEFNDNNVSVDTIIPMYTTPCIIWSNYSNLSTGESTRMDSMNLGEKVMEIANLDMPNYFYELRDLRYGGMEAFAGNYVIIDGIVYPQNTETYQQYADRLGVLWGDIVGPYKYMEVDNGDDWLLKNNRQYVWPTYYDY